MAGKKRPKSLAQTGTKAPAKTKRPKKTSRGKERPVTLAPQLAGRSRARRQDLEMLQARARSGGQGFIQVETDRRKTIATSVSLFQQTATATHVDTGRSELLLATTGALRGPVASERVA